MALKQVTFEVDEDLFKKFSIKCIEKSKTKREVLVEFMEQFVKSK